MWNKWKEQKKKILRKKKKKKIRRATDPIDQIPCNMLMFFVIILNTRGFERLWNNSMLRARTEHNISSTAEEENVEEGEKYCKTTSELMSAIKTIKKSHKNNIFHILSSSSFPCQHLYSLYILIILYCELFSEVEWNAWNAYMHHTS